MNRRLLPPLATLLLALLTTISAPGAEETGQEAAKEAPKQPIAKLILGSWKVDVPKTLAAMIRRTKETNGNKELDQKREERMARNVTQMASNLQLEFQADGVVVAHRPAGGENASYTILRSDDATGKFAMSVKPVDEEDADTAACHIEGDTMVMGVQDGKFEIHLQRLTAKEAEAHRAQMKEKRLEIDPEEEDSTESNDGESDDNR